MTAAERALAARIRAELEELERVEALASGVWACFRRLCEDLDRFCRFLSEDDATTPSRIA